MKNFFSNFQDFLKNRPRFNIKYIMMECPEFIVKLLPGKHYREPENDLFFLGRQLQKTAQPETINKKQNKRPF